MVASQHINQTYFLAVNSLNPSLTSCLLRYNLQICLLYRRFCSLAYKSNTRTFLVSSNPNKTWILAYLMVFKLRRRLIIISCCRSTCKNIGHIMRFALRSLTTSVTPYLTSFNIYIYHTYILRCILISKYFTGTLFLNSLPLSTFFVVYLYFLTFNCIQRKVLFGLMPLKHKLQILTSFIAPK